MTAPLAGNTSEQHHLQVTTVTAPLAGNTSEQHSSGDIVTLKGKNLSEIPPGLEIF